jgi:hypothetical protein
LAGRVLVAGLALGGAALYGQTAQSAGTVSAAMIAAQGAALQTPLNLKIDDTDAGYSSSSSEAPAAPEVAANTADHFNFVNAMQYGGGRQRSGRPRYRGSNSNADGSAKWDFFVGGGFGIPVGNQFNYATTGWGFGGGGGRMFNAHLGVNLEFNYDHFGMSNATLNNQENLYNNLIDLYCTSDPTDCANNGVSTISGLGGNNHVWSFSLQPIYNIRSGEGLGAYVTGGVGFYHKVANFTEPEVGCDPYILEYYGICEETQANEVIDHYTSNAPGFDGGFGLTYKFSRFASERLYGEVRYVYVLNSARAGVDASTCTTVSCASDNSNVANDFPQNSNRTSYIPVKVGLRF